MAREAYANWGIRMRSYNHESSDLPSPLGVKAHSSQGMAGLQGFSGTATLQGGLRP